VGTDKFAARHSYANPLNKHEWFSGPASSHDKAQKIGLLAPSALFLHDMLGNVSEMTASFYQIEYYQGRVGGFVARGGNYTTPEDRIRTSLRSEQPFYRDLIPQSSPTLGMRLTLSSVIFAARGTSAELEAAWPDYLFPARVMSTEQHAEEFLRRRFVPMGLYQNVEDVAVLIHGTPEAMALPNDGEEHFIEVPLIGRPGASPLQCIRISLPKLPAPIPHGFVGQDNAAFGRQLFDVPVTEAAAEIQPDAVG
jgi:hypothetical protein